MSVRSLRHSSMEALFRHERALKRCAPIAHSTHPPSPSPSHSASPQRRTKLAEHRSSSAATARRQGSLAGRFISATAATPSPPPPRATSTTCRPKVVRHFASPQPPSSPERRRARGSPWPCHFTSLHAPISSGLALR